MAYSRLNENEKARRCFDRAAQWRMGFDVTEEELRRLCAEAAGLLGVEVPPTLRESPVLTPGPKLLAPAVRATLDPGVDRSSVWEFDWSDVPGATRYHLYLFRPNPSKATYINDPAITSSACRVKADRCVHDRADPRRYWKVRALVNGVWSDWSEEGTFTVAPLDDNKPPSPLK
jgi:hypothetical protein